MSAPFLPPTSPPTTAPAAVPMPMRLAAFFFPPCGLWYLCAEMGATNIPSSRQAASTNETSLNLFSDCNILIPPCRIVFTRRPPRPPRRLDVFFPPARRSGRRYTLGADRRRRDAPTSQAPPADNHLQGPN